MAAITTWSVSEWPFDMVKFLDYYTIIFRAEPAASSDIDVYEAYCGTDDVWVATKVIDNIGYVDYPDPRYPVNLDVADFAWFYLLTYAELKNGEIEAGCYYREPGIASGTDALTALPLSNCPDFITCCNFKGQPVVGGVLSTDAYWTQLGKCSVAWSGIGHFEFRPDVNRTAGFVRMPWSDWDEGLVLKVKRLGDSLIVYGNGGRAALDPFYKEPITGFGLDDRIGGTGIHSGFHMDGNQKVHGFIDTRNDFWIVQGKKEFKKLGYREWIEDMQAENDAEESNIPIVVSYEPKRNFFYLAGFGSCYVLTEFGLYSCTQSPTSIGDYRGNVLTGFVKDHSDDEGRVLFNPVDFKIRGLKTVEEVEFGMDYTPTGSESVTAKVDFKYDYDESSWRTSGWERLNPQGMYFPVITANDLKVGIKFSDYTDGDPRLESTVLRWKLSDKRGIRGLYSATQAVGKRDRG